MSADPSGPGPAESTAGSPAGAVDPNLTGTPPVAPPELTTDAKGKGKGKDKAAQPSAPPAKKEEAPVVPLTKPLKAATRKLIAEAGSIEKLSEIVAGLSRADVEAAQADIYQARRRIVAAGIPKG